MMMRYVAVVLALTLGACAEITLPVAVLGTQGEVLTGTATASLDGAGHFQVTDGRLTCAGTYDSFSTSPTISFPVQCNNGQRGFGTATRENDGLGGSGVIRMSDGRDWRFVFGKAAQAF